MQSQDVAEITYRGQTMQFPSLAVGGTVKAPLLKPLDRLLLEWVVTNTPPGNRPAVGVWHDEFGVLTSCLHDAAVAFVSDNVLHRDRMLAAFRENLREPPPAHHSLAACLGAPGQAADSIPSSPQTEFSVPSFSAPLHLLRLPKSLELFAQYLRAIVRFSPPNARVAVGFMTRHFTLRMLEIAGEFATEVSQSRAYKKSRLLVLDKLRAPQIATEMQDITFGDTVYQQYGGVFSSGRIDYASQWLLDSWTREPELADLPPPAEILDIGCGNGVLGHQLRLRHYPQVRVAGTDVSSLAIASARVNVPDADLHWRADLGHWPDQSFALVVTNPPFHDGHRNDISTSLQLFAAARKKLRPGGHLVIVANRHLNYATHLRPLFAVVLTVAENRKYVIYRCSAPVVTRSSK